MIWKKLITLDNQFQADLLTDALGKADLQNGWDGLWCNRSHILGASYPAI